MGFLFRKKRNLPEYFFKRGEECLKKGNLKWALESLNKAIELDPELEMAYLRRAETLRKLGREKEAAWDLVKFVEYDRRGPDNPGDLDDVIKEAFKIARIDMQRKDVKDELVVYGIPKLLDEIMAGFDPRADYGDKKFYKLALSWLRKHPEHDGRYEGFIRLIKGDLNGAINKFKEAIEGDPEDPRPYYFTGIALLRKLSRGRRPPLRHLESEEELSGRVRSMFESAISRGLEGRICSSCGYRDFSSANFCLRCGKELLFV
jgi:tetratricopeptide (TPR) repeat protein